MRKRMIGIMLALLALTGLAQMNVIRQMPLSSQPTSPWWVANPTGTNLTVQDALQTINTNFHAADNRLLALESAPSGGGGTNSGYWAFDGTNLSYTQTNWDPGVVIPEVRISDGTNTVFSVGMDGTAKFGAIPSFGGFYPSFTINPDGSWATFNNIHFCLADGSAQFGAVTFSPAGDITANSLLTYNGIGVPDLTYRSGTPAPWPDGVITNNINGVWTSFRAGFNPDGSAYFAPHTTSINFGVGFQDMIDGYLAQIDTAGVFHGGVVATNLWLFDSTGAEHQVVVASDGIVKTLETENVSLPDAATNAMLNSWRVVAATTNLVHVNAGVTNVLPWTFSSLAGITWTTTLGTPLALYSTDGGTTWNSSAEKLVTNSSVKLAFTGAWASEIGSILPTPIPFPAELTGLTIYGMGRPDLLGRTNTAIGERVFVSAPLGPDDATPKSYVDQLFQTADWWSAPGDVEINGHALHLSATWQLATAATTNYDACELRWLGVDVLTVRQPVPQSVSGTAITLDGTGTNVVVSVATNGLTAAPRLKLSHILNPPIWSWMTNAASVTGTNYVWTFPLPYSDSGFIVTMTPSSTPGLISLAEVLQLSPRTITNSTSSTWGYSAGILCADADYIYVSVGTNAWKRAALSSW